MQSVGTFLGLNIGRSALSAAQLGQDVVGQNIANANTPGYSQESVALTENDPSYSPGAWQGGQVGTGVSANTITRASSEFLNAQVRSANAEQGNQQAQSSWLDNIQTAFNEPGNTTINTQLQTFFDNFSAVQNNPQDNGVRETAIQGGVTLASMIQTTQNQLTQAGTQIGIAAAQDMTQINQYGQQIAQLNKAIVAANANGQSPNALLDQRDTILDSLSKLTNFQTSTNVNGMMNVRIGTSNLVEGANGKTLSLSTLQSNGDITNGELYGLSKTQTNLSAYQGQLNNLASQLIAQVNALHQQGTGSDGTTGLAFFTGTDASNIAVNQTLVSSPQKLAVGGALVAPATTPAPGDASNAAAIAALATQTLGSSAGALSGQTFGGYYNALVTQVGSQDASAKTTLNTAQATQTQLSNQRSQVTGVNVDDEMTNMIRFQRMYEAASKVIATQNTMLGDLMSMIQ